MVPMKGLWVWSDSAKKQSVLDEIRKSHLDRILSVLSKNQGRGLSNAEIDSTLGVWSHWTIHWKLTELLALGLIEYNVELFGEPGRYAITPLGVTVLMEVG
jgi:hypothetical protein